MNKGTVKWFNDQRGYGFIQPAAAERTCSCTSPQSSGRLWRGLSEGQRVIYELQTDSRKNRKDVRGQSEGCVSLPQTELGPPCPSNFSGRVLRGLLFASAGQAARSSEWRARIGSVRMRRPVAANRALARAGAIGGTPGSPTPPGSSRPAQYAPRPRASHLIQDGIVAEVCLHNTALLDRDLAFERRRKAECDACLPFALRQVGIYGEAAVDGADDAMNLDRARLTDGNLRNLSDVAAEGVVDRQPRCRPWGGGVPQPAFSAARSRTPR